MSAEDIVSRINSAEFSTPVRGGYDVGEVDAFLDALCAKVAAGEPWAAMIPTASFTLHKWRGGYDPEEVDAFLRSLVEKS